jgi:hypothetical protein
MYVCMYVCMSTSTLVAQTHQVCTKIKDATNQCPGFDGVNVTVKDRFGNVVCSGVSANGGEYCCTVNAESFPITVCSDVTCPRDESCIDEDDFDFLQFYILSYPNNPPVPGDFFYWADMNGDGKINQLDLLVLLHWINNSPNNIPSSACRLISGGCKAGSLQYGITCYNNCTTFTNPSDINLDFWLYMLGDVAFPFCSDPDCTKPLQEEEESESFRVNVLVPPSIVTSEYYMESSTLHCTIKTENPQNIQYSLIDVHGNVILNEYTTAQSRFSEKSFDLSQFKSGVYYFRVYCNSQKEPYMKKILISNW